MGLRGATEQDIPEILGIYNSAVLTKLSTADTAPVSVASRLEWFRKHQPERRPLLVYEHGGEVMAWVSFEDFYGRPAYHRTAEISIYIATEHQGKRLGQELLQAAAGMAPKLGVNTLIGYVFDHNTPSMRLFRSLGFCEWGRLPRVADIGGKEVSVCILGKRVAD
ncbi:MAG TPA: GNAT family N-acetyltransferase [Alcanivorax sp.]|nr:GNAT family N-acetyltransferase [Alcanivorax sp.]